ncbi:hypothetical protein EDC05_000459 [Coemansia umbellata]|uniref:Protein kinase domain-containing protein n=1 Tax=Coemansia umbellata TaxID=1424467 RepID=A0ABQ8PUX5_9FUNG|nr:hypothetical protein EDC05_000459 [Coemansia umbellata]
MASDCGYPIIDYFAELARKENLEKCAEKLADYTKQVANTLVHAYGAGILHRDISAGNSERQRGVYKANKQVDDIDTDRFNILKSENEYDQFTGIPLYMSIRKLRGSSMRDVIHDI